MPQRFQAYGLQAEIWIPLTRSQDTPRADEESKATVLARLKPGLTLATASADLDLIVKRLALLHPGDFPKHFKARIQSATDSLLGPQGGATTFHSDMKHLLYDLLAAVAILLKPAESYSLDTRHQTANLTYSSGSDGLCDGQEHRSHERKYRRH